MDNVLETPAVQSLPVAQLQPHPHNSRTHSDKQIQQIANSIRQFGFNCPVVVDGKHRIIAGHGRVEAVKRLGLSQIPTICVNHLSEEQIRAFIIADNKIAQNAGWDMGQLKIELQHFISTNLDFDVEITGFTTPEIDVITAEVMPAPAENNDDTIPDLNPSNSICQPGDVWQLGSHRLMCGNALEATTYETLMQGKKAHMIFADPPYNVPIDGHVGGLGSIKHREFAMASGEMSAPEFTAFLQQAFTHMQAQSVNGSLHYLCMDWRHITEITQAANAVYSELKNLCVWAKDNGGMGSLYRSRHELVFVYKNGTGRHLNNVELGKHGRYRTNVWEYAGVNTMRKGRMNELAMHPTVKPTTMVADAIKDCTKHSELVLDPFAGSGTTLIAAEKTARRCYAIELDAHYCDVIINRWQALTQQEAIEEISGNSFTQLQRGMA